MSQFGNVPPAFGEGDPFAEQKSWPKVIGIISIVLASLSLVCGGCGIFQNIAAVTTGGSQIQTPSGQTIQLPPPTTFLIVLMVAGWLWAVLLLVAGIQTLRRSKTGRSLHLIYGAVSVLMTFVTTAASWSYAQATVQALSSDPQMAKMSGFITGAIYGSMCFSIVLGLGYPVFLIIWFGLIKKRHEDMGPPPQELVA